MTSRCTAPRPARGLRVTLLVAAALLMLRPQAALADAPGSDVATVRAENGVVATDHELASAVGVQILQQGGNAADAAVAAGLTLGVVNPFASGLGGGGFLIWYDGEEAVAFDFREDAPEAATESMYVRDGEVVRTLSREGGLAVGVPGEAAGWWEVHQRYGALPWADVVEPARALASEGFPVGSLLAERLRQSDRYAASPQMVSAFQDGDGWYEEGDLLTRPALGRTLAALQDDGIEPFYRGWIAEDVVEAVQGAGGIMTVEDLATYEVLAWQPVSFDYRGYRILSMPPPSSGGIVLAQILGALDAYHLDRVSFETAGSAHAIVQMSMHAFADRAAHLGDARFWDVPTDSLLSPDRLAAMRASFDPVRTLDIDAYGSALPAPDDHGTSHFSIVDPAGRAVACTVTINTSFGSLVLTERSGLVLNNEMDDFSAQPGVPNTYGLIGTAANAIAPNKRPLSSMSPTIATREGALVGTLGGSGGPMIISGVMLTLLRLIDHGADVGAAVSAPRFHHQWVPNTLFVEEGGPDGWTRFLESYGYEVVVRPFPNAVQAIWRDGGAWTAASDPRKHGAPAGF